MKTLVERLLACKDDRGLMANLRCALIARKRYRAWPALNRLGVNIDNDVDVFVAGLFATHPEATDKGNFGKLCKLIELNRDASGSKDAKLTPTERRFQHALAASRMRSWNASCVLYCWPRPKVLLSITGSCNWICGSGTSE